LGERRGKLGCSKGMEYGKGEEGKGDEEGGKGMEPGA